MKDFYHKSRLYRIEQRNRILKKTKKIAGHMFPIDFLYKTHDAYMDFITTWSKHNFNNRKPCSCASCGNFRKNRKGLDKLKRQEIRNHFNSKEMEDEQ